MYIVKSETLASIANAIRNKGETYDALSYPFGFISALNDLPTDDIYNSLDRLIEGRCQNYSDHFYYYNDVATVIPSWIFYNFTYGLERVSFPKCKKIEKYAFYNCQFIHTAAFNSCEEIEDRAFYFCLNLKSVYFLGSKVVSPLAGVSTIFASTGFTGYSDYVGSSCAIYVPANLLSDYKNDAKWLPIESFIKAI